MRIITNNPMVNKNYSTDFNVEYFEVGYVDTLRRVRDYIHMNYKLLTHPLSGSVKPDETPYKSVMIEECKEFDYDSLVMIEEAIQRAEFMIKDSKKREYTEKLMTDFQYIDKSLIDSALESHKMFGNNR